jgi:hypothetical protein
MHVAQVASEIAVPEARLSGYPAIQCASLLHLASIAFSCSARFGLLTNAVNSTKYTVLDLESLVNNKLKGCERKWL